MIYRILADIAVITHLLFILFVLFGGFFALYRPKLAWLHIPAFVWGGVLSIFGWVCPLTYLENDLRTKGTAAGYDTSFIEEYILPIIYPEELLGSFPKSGFVTIGIFVLTLNICIYGFLLIQRRTGSRK